jgi:hypothetical protein
MLTTSAAVHPQSPIKINSMGLLADFSAEPASIMMEWRLPAIPTNLALSVQTAFADIIDRGSLAIGNAQSMIYQMREL